MARLIAESGAEAGNVYDLDRPLLTVGRSVQNNIQIVDRRMSRQHAEVLVSGGRVVMRDLGSKNGTLLNGQPLIGSAELHHGDRIAFGDTILYFDANEVPGAPATRPGSEDLSVAAARTDRVNDSNSSASGFKVVEEDMWGRTRNTLRAGYDPNQSMALQTSAGTVELRDLSRRIEVLYQVTDAIRSVFTIDELLNRIMDIITSLLKPDRGYLLLVNPETQDLDPVVVRSTDGKTGTADREVHISSSITHRCLKEGSALLVSDAAADNRFNSSESIILNRIRTAVAAPMIYKNEAIGVIYIDTQSRSYAFSDEELELITSIANQAAVAIVNARLHAQLVEQHKLAREMEIARSIQMNLLPKTYPDLPGYQLSAMSLPAKQVGGDYYDFLALPDGRVGLAIADVSGKGVSAAILTATTRSYLQSETQHKDVSLTTTMARINQMVHRDVTNGMYVTMVLGYLDPTEGDFDFVNAGHAHPVLVHPNGELEYLKAGGLFLGIMEDTQYEQGRVTIPPGAVLVLYTDGVTDILSPQGKSFGSEPFFDLIRDKQHLHAEDIRNAIYQACLKHRGEADQFDDFTLIVLKRLDFNESEMDF